MTTFTKIFTVILVPVSAFLLWYLGEYTATILSCQFDSGIVLWGTRVAAVLVLLGFMFQGAVVFLGGLIIWLTWINLTPYMTPEATVIALLLSIIAALETVLLLVMALTFTQAFGKQWLRNAYVLVYKYTDQTPTSDCSG